MGSGIDYRDPKWVASRLGLDKNTVYRLLQDGTLPAVQIGKKWLISETRLGEYLEEQTRLQTTLRRMTALPATGQVLENAYREAARYRHPYVGQEHILLALTVVDGVAKDALSQVGVDEAKVRSLFEAELAPGSSEPRKKPELMLRARRAISLAADEAQRSGRVAYGPEHLLIGLLRTGEGAGFHLLTSLGIGLDTVRAMVAPKCSDAALPELEEESEQST
jgi:excisionase family DNA binding protein